MVAFKLEERDVTVRIRTASAGSVGFRTGMATTARRPNPAHCLFYNCSFMERSHTCSFTDVVWLPLHNHGRGRVANRLSPCSLCGPFFTEFASCDGSLSTCLGCGAQASYIILDVPGVAFVDVINIAISRH